MPYGTVIAVCYFGNNIMSFIVAAHLVIILLLLITYVAVNLHVYKMSDMYTIAVLSLLHIYLLVVVWMHDMVLLTLGISDDGTRAV